MGASSASRLLSALALAALVAACTPSVATQTITGVVAAGPTCPVVNDPRDPSCEDQPVAGARIVVLDVDGREVAIAVTGAEGRFSIELEPGRYELVAQPMEGLLGTPAPVSLVVVEGVDPEPITLVYDTGIR
jgi:hypothetical protein